MVKLCTKQHFIICKLESLHSARVPIVVSAYFELLPVFAVESELENERFTLLENHFDLLYICRQFACFLCLFLSALALLSII